MRSTDADAARLAADLAHEHEALIQFLYLAPVGLVQTTLAGEIVMINPISAQLLMPLSREADLSNLFQVLENVAPDLRHVTAAFDRPHGMVCDGMRIALQPGMRGQGDPGVLQLSLLKLDENRLMAVLSDVTMQVRRERLLRQNEAWLNAIMTGVNDYALVRLDAQGRIDEWNPSIGRVTGFADGQAVGQPYSIFYPADATTPERLADRLREADDNGWSLDDGWRQRADGSRFWGSAMIAPLREREPAEGAPTATSATEKPLAPVDDGESAYCLVIRDITDKRLASEALRKATSCDHLTGLANRRAFFEAAELELARWHRLPRPLSLVLFDADHFKAVNDQFGHAAGDAVLCHLAGLLGAGFRPVDVVARVGGEEFAVLLPSTDLATAARVAERLRQAVQDAVVEHDGHAIRYTVSGGVASMNDGTNGLEALMKRADQALYAAKAGGRNRIEAAAPAATKNLSPDDAERLRRRV